MAKKPARTKATAVAPEEKETACKEAVQAARFLEKVKSLHYWPEVALAEWKELYRDDYGVELTPRHFAYRKVSDAIKNAKYQANKCADPHEREQRAAVQAAMEESAPSKKALAALKV